MTLPNSTNLRTLLGILAACAILAAPLLGAGFWDKKDFTQWTERELRKIYLDSPWAKKITVPLGNPMAAFSGGGGAGGRRGAGGGGGAGGGPPGGGGGGAGGRRGGGGGGFGGGMPQGGAAPTLDLIVRFDEAAPVKAAKVKFNMGESTELTPRMQQYLDSEQEYYIVVIEGLPQILARLEEAPERLANSARLRRKGKQDIVPATVEVATENRKVSFKYFFMRDDPIVLADKEVEFFMKLERPQMGAGGRPQGRQQRQGGQRGAQGQQRQRQQGQGQGQGQGRGAAGGRPGGGNMMMAIFGKEIKKKFRLKDMVYKGDLAL